MQRRSRLRWRTWLEHTRTERHSERGIRCEFRREIQPKLCLQRLLSFVHLE